MSTTNTSLITNPARSSRWLSTAALIVASLAVHWFVGWTGSNMTNMSPFNDVALYSTWVNRGLAINQWPGTNEPGVYPLLALIPMIIAHLISSNAVFGWLTFITALNTAAIVVVSRRVNGVHAAAYWLTFIALLGPVAIGRIDAVAAAIDLFAVIAMLAGKDRLTIGLATAGAWIKIWPVVHVIARLVSAKNRTQVTRWVGVALAVSLGVIAVGIALGGNENMFSFLWLMGNRGIQIESPIAMPWMWGTHLGWGESSVYFESNIITFQVLGPGSEVVSKLMLPTLLIALGITAFLGWRAARSGADTGFIFVLTGLTATLDLIVFNKVGSPQFEAWLAIPLIAGLLFGIPSWRLPLWFGLAIAALTQWVYPLNYDAVVNTDALALTVLTARNVLLIALLVWANVRLSALSSRATR
ncbi:MAG: DUF2029 domain-containing protein [Actinomycetales bacterium]|nr:DUF2029 domain-containing protein [Actinomycetales bacterium]